MKVKKTSVKKVVIISFSDLKNDPRVQRQIRLLAPFYQVVAIGESDPKVPGVEFIVIQKPKGSVLKKLCSFTRLISGRYDQFYWKSNLMQHCLQQLGEIKNDLIIANDILTLPLALKMANGAKVLFDAHEYFPREFEDQFWWRIFFQSYIKHLCKKYIPLSDEITTVCQGIAEEFHKHYRIEPHVVTNAPYYSAFIPSPPKKDSIRMIYHGAAGPSRKLENLIEIMNLLDERFTLDLMLVSNSKRYVRKLHALAAHNCKIRFLPPVSFYEIIPFTNQYDIGLFLLEPVNFNYYHALPNKLFEFIQARLAVAVGPSPEMARIVRQYGCGVVSNDFTPKSLADQLNQLTPEKISEYKHQSDLAAKELCAEKNQKFLLDLIKNLIT